MKRVEFKVGERITITLEVVEHSTCEGCFFKGINDYCNAVPLGLMCVSKYPDHKNIIFKEVKE